MWLVPGFDIWSIILDLERAVLALLSDGGETAVS